MVDETKVTMFANLMIPWVCLLAPL